MVFSLFEEHYNGMDDAREPWISGLKIPGFQGSFSILAPLLGPWLQLGVIFAINVIIQSTSGAIIYQTIIRNRGKQFTYVLGYGIIIPLICSFPFYVIDLLDIRSRFARLPLVTAPTVVAFRVVEAMHGTSPASVETSIMHYITYYSSLFDFYWDEKTNSRERISAKELRLQLWRISTHLILLSVIHSYLDHYHFKPFPSPVQLDQYHISFDLLQPGQLLNNYLYALLTFFGLSLGWNLAALAFNLQGYRTVAPFDNPLFTSRSASDFWGRKWNITIHETVKRAAFKPVRKAGYGSLAAILAAFLASGLLHDYTWAVLFTPPRAAYNEEGKCIGFCWYPLIGKQSAFFLYCGLTMLLEKPAGKLPVIKWAAKNLPTVTVSTFVVLTALPIAHWYPGDWIVGQYWHDYSIGIFKIVYSSPP